MNTTGRRFWRPGFLLWWLGVVLLNPCNLLQAQSPDFHVLNREAGLPHRSVYAIVQHPTGYLLVGTALGLYKYDGLSFAKVPFSRTTTTRHEQVFGLSVGGNGNGYFWNLSGSLFEFAGDSIREFEFTDVTDPVQVKNFYLGTGEYWGYVTGKEALLKVDLRTGELVASFPNSRYVCFGEDREENFYALKGDSIRVFVPNGTTFTYPLPKWKASEQDLELRQNPQGTPIVIARKNGHVYEISWSPETGVIWKAQYLSPKPNAIYAYFQESADKIWLGTENGVIGIGKANRGRELIVGKPVRAIHKDREQNFWFAVYPEGIYQTPSLDIGVYSVEEETLPNNIISSLINTQDGGVLVGMDFGYYAKVQGGKVDVFSTDPARNLSIQFHRSAEGELFLNQSGGYVQAIEQSGRPKGVKMPTGAVETVPFYADEWVMGTYRNVFLVSAESGALVRGEKLTPGRWYSHLAYPQKDQFYFSIDTVIYAYDRTTQALSTYDLSDWGLRGSVLALARQDEILWFTVYSEGVFGMQDGVIVERYTEEEGLNGYGFSELALDEDELWVGSSDGLHHIDLKTRHVRNFDDKDGLVNNDVTRILVQEDTLWVGTTEGLTRIPVAALLPEPVPPPIYLTGLAIWEKDTLLTDSLVLEHDENNLKIEFQGLNFKSRGEFSYAYRLLGVDEGWIKTASSSNFARYPQLQPGKYIFEVIARTRQGVESEAPARMVIVIEPAFWQEWWFWALIALAIGSVIFFSVYLYIRSLKRKNEDRERLITSQLTALRTQMNPHFIFNALNSIQVFIAQSDTLSANFYLNQFSVLMRLVLDMSTQSAITLAQELEALELYLSLEQLRFEEDFSYEVQVDPALEDTTVLIPAMLIQPYVENAIKHGLLHKEKEKNLWVRIHRKSPELLVAEIEDNGVGRAEVARIQQRKRKRHRSQAQALTVRRLELLTQSYTESFFSETEDLTDVQGVACGTRVTLHIPIVPHKPQKT